MTISFEMLGLLAPAFCAGLVVAATHVPLGQEVLKRGIIFIDLAIAQIAALGVVLAHVVFRVDYGMMPLLIALLFAITGGVLFAWLERKVPHLQEAFIGSAFVVSASLILLVLAGDPHGGEQMQSILAGQILWVGWKQVIFTALIYAGLLALWFGLPTHRTLLFYLIFPVTVTLAVQMVGVYLVFASLILPALGTAGLQRVRLSKGYMLAFGAVTAGLIASAVADLPAGPVLVCCYALIGLVFYLAGAVRRRSYKP